MVPSGKTTRMSKEALQSARFFLKTDLLAKIPLLPRASHAPQRGNVLEPSPLPPLTAVSSALGSLANDGERRPFRWLRLVGLPLLDQLAHGNAKGFRSAYVRIGRELGECPRGQLNGGIGIHTPV